MHLLINNEDGNGFLDYTAALTATGPLTITQQAGEYTTCQASLDVVGNGLPMPVLRASVMVQSDAGALLFQGFLTDLPNILTAIEMSNGEVNAVHVLATETALASGFPPATPLQPATSQTHAVSFEENAIRLREVRDRTLPLLATDITLSGEVGAGAYVTEVFQGDGSMVSFALTGTPFRITKGATLLKDSFDGPQFAGQTWRFSDPGQHIGLGSGGLSVTGGNGLDGQTVMQAVTPVELGGTITAELSSVALQPGSDGVVLGFYSNAVGIPTCVAGFRVKGAGGAQTIVALANGVESGTPFTFAAGHLYTLRVRLHSPEMQRVLETYDAVVDGALQSFGGGLIDAPLQLSFEIRDQGLASSTVASVLYTGALASSPARAIFAPVNSAQLQMRMGGCAVKGGGSAWLVSTLPDGTTAVRREAAPEEGGDFALSTSTLHFFPGRAPAAGERVSLFYRRGDRSVAHVQDSGAMLAARNIGPAGTLSWSGSVASGSAASSLPAPAGSVAAGSTAAVSRVPRSTVDCVAAARALFAFSSAAGTGRAGRCLLRLSGSEVVPGSIPRPGDRMLIPSAAGAPALQLPVRRVVLTDEHAVPELLTCEVDFEQRSANGLSFHVSTALAADVPQPVPVNSSAALGGLPSVQVLSATTSALQVDAGTAPPAGGGFEVRRRDGGFGTVIPGGGVDPDLVLRSPVRGFSIPRLSFEERFYVRMYDGNLPPNYSAICAVLVTHFPVN